MHYEENPKAKLEQALAAARARQPDSEAVKAAGERVWQRLSEEVQNGQGATNITAIRGCDDVRALLPQYHAKKLSTARALLVEDHLHECAACHREAERAWGERKTTSAALLPWKQELPKMRQGPFRWAAIAAAVLAFNFAGYQLP